MIVLVANLGSTSFKLKLMDMPADEGDQPLVLARGAADRIGLDRSDWSVEAEGRHEKGTSDLTDHAAAIQLLLDKLVELKAVESTDEIDAIGFKAVHGGPIKEPVRVDQKVLETMRHFSDVAPQHNPPYIAAMEAFARQLPEAAQVAAFETGFHQTIPLARQAYGIPYEWMTEFGIRRYGFHGASHRYIATRMAEIAPDCRRLISCHLGGSCSISAILDGKSQANSFGMTTQGGVFHASRVGDFDAFAIMKLLAAGIDLEEVWRRLSKEGGLAGLSGVSSDLREVEAASAKGNEQAELAIEAFVDSIRHYVGAYLAVLNGADALVFTGGIGQNGAGIRQAVCENMSYAGIVLDDKANEALGRDVESRIDAGRGVQIWVVPTDEELIVARQAMQVLEQET